MSAAIEYCKRHWNLHQKPNQRTGQRLSFIDVFTFAGLETLERQEMSVAETTTRFRDNPVCFKAQNRDRSKPCALSPNSIPLRKRPILSGNIDRYGVDPYFRAWIRANVNSQTRCSTYAEFLIEKDDNPLVNKKLQYADITLNRGNVDALVRDDRAWKEQFPSSVNRAKYDHNRRLECRKAVDHGSRLRVLRFSFRHPIYPPHTPEMDTLGLDKHAYQSIVANIDRMSSGMPINTRCPCEYMLDSLNKSRRRGTKEALMKVREFMKRLNASQRNIVWVIEKIPWVGNQRLGRTRSAGVAHAAGEMGDYREANKPR